MRAMTRLPLSRAACWWLILALAGWGAVAVLLAHPRAGLALIAAAAGVELLDQLRGVLLRRVAR